MSQKPITHTHHRFSPSRLGRIALCPGSVAMEERADAQGFGLEEAADEATEGTKLHARVHPDATLEDLNEEQRWAVESARRYIQSKMPPDDDGRQLYEWNLTLWRPGALGGGEPINWGTGDWIGLPAGEVVRLLDLKFGRATLFKATVELQMRAYAAAAMQAFNRPRAEVFVYQPRESVEFFGAYQDPERLAGEIHEIIEHARENPELLRPSLEACRHCRGKGSCPAFRQEVLAAVPATKEATAGLDPAQLTRALDFAALVEPWAKAVRERARGLLEVGGELQGWMLAERRLRKVTNVCQAFEAVEGVLSQEEFLSAAELRITALESAYTKRLKETEGTSIKEGKERLSEALAPCLEIEVQRYLKRKEG